ncbi:ubiquitin binding protein [Basidiobolus meristosporus CBS 931.73]|uniref:Vacuolar protein sorting-associated protein 27 n=1 Tax=Basidiobolus meristosporus CBS 931.73 TaxID=1314790 RepID=A0A1Y1YRC3_9FUNG|nr:ubiquitin binding protein [Basidiobolus meristosporus CBS 931.73]|eukprot:ORY00573.1 ubiquitin binding protein [Basidiobolus meristosporus CBS 931.73]
MPAVGMVLNDIFIPAFHPEKATSETIPNGEENITLNFDICDKIKSKKVSAKDAVRALIKRLNHNNPNVQLLALKLTDACVKNGGKHFLVEIASREFMDNLVSILKSPTGVNRDVKSKILELIKAWAEAFQSQSELSYVQQVYRQLEAEGFSFPKNSKVNPTLFDTATAPEWSDSDVCMRCRVPFTMTNRKHHCRNCGQTFCQQCSSNSMPLPHFGIHEDVRVCHGCYPKLKKVVSLTPSFQPSSLGTATEPSKPIVPPASKTTATTGPSNSTSATNADDEDEDLKRAIELSIKEAESRSGYGGYTPASQNKPQAQAQVKSTPEVKEEDDPDLAAAIAASLKETHISQSWSNLDNTRHSPYENVNTNSQSQKASAPSPNELSKLEQENIEMFVTLISRIQQSGDDVARDPHIQGLYGQVAALQPKLVNDLETTIQKHRDFVQLNEKITTAVKLYDRLLEERLSGVHSMPSPPQNVNRYQPSHSQAYPPLPSTPQQYPQVPTYLDYNNHPTQSAIPYEEAAPKFERQSSYNHPQQQYGNVYPPAPANPPQGNYYPDGSVIQGNSQPNNHVSPSDPRNQPYFNNANGNYPETNNLPDYSAGYYTPQPAPSALPNNPPQAAYPPQPVSTSYPPSTPNLPLSQPHQPSSTPNYQQGQLDQSQSQYQQTSNPYPPQPAAEQLQQPTNPGYQQQPQPQPQQQFANTNVYPQAPIEQQQYQQPPQPVAPGFQAPTVAQPLQHQQQLPPPLQPQPAGQTSPNAPKPEASQPAQETPLIEL